MAHRESEIQWLDTDRIFHTPGISYRPANLKALTVLLGEGGGHDQTSRKVYKNFNLTNLTSDNLDPSHKIYEKYLQYSYFTPAGEKRYFAHTMYNTVGTTALHKGMVNLFPLDLASDDIKTPAISLGVVKSSPLYVEVELLPADNFLSWFLVYTFVYKHKIDFTGSKLKQDVTFDYLK